MIDRLYFRHSSSFSIPSVKYIIPSKYAKFGNMGPFRTLCKYNTKHLYGPLITPKDDHFAKIALKLNKK